MKKIDRIGNSLKKWTPEQLRAAGELAMQEDRAMNVTIEKKIKEALTTGNGYKIYHLHEQLRSWAQLIADSVERAPGITEISDETVSMELEDGQVRTVKKTIRKEV